MVENQSKTIGPKRTPTLPVPNLWMANSVARMPTASGTAQCASIGALTESPSTALRTEIAGVSMPSA